MQLKKLSILLLLFVFNYCEEIPNDTIELGKVEYVVKSISAPEVFTYSTINRYFVPTISIQNSKSVEQVWFDLIAVDGQTTVVTQIEMIAKNTIDDITTFEGSLEMDQDLLSGKYEIIIYIQDNVRTSDENVTKVASQIFQFYSTAENFPPVISNLIMPNEIDRGDVVSISLIVTDPNGLSDVDSVYYQAYDPDGNLVSNSQNISKFPLFDNGDTENTGDVNANDGVFNALFPFPSSAQTGNWTFTFNAIDKSDSISNTISHIMNVK